MLVHRMPRQKLVSACQLILALRAYLTGSLGEDSLIATQVINPVIPIVLVAAIMRRQPSSFRAE